MNISLCLLSALAQGAAAPAPVEPDDEVVVTASLLPPAEEQIASTTLLPQRTIEALSPALVPDLLRLSPGVAVATSGAPGQQTQVRIRGAEANHTLLFVDGIQLNDVSAGNEARFETLATDGTGRIEFVRGPQSALYGSEALGGVIALQSPFARAAEGRGLLEIGARGNRRAAARASLPGVTIGGSFINSDGIDVLGGGGGDRDGFENRTAFLSARGDLGERLGAVFAARYIDHDVEFDGTDPVTFLRADTADASRTRTGAVRGALSYGGPDGFGAGVDAQYLGSSSRNRNGSEALNRTRGERLRFGGEAGYASGPFAALVRAEHEEEDFLARDQAYFGATDQDRSRARTAVVGTVRGVLGPVTAEAAIRHDSFNRFRNATTVRVGAVADIGRGLSLAGSYGEGIAQPTFFDLYGFFPGSFIGNPALRPERSRGYELGFRYRSARLDVSATGFSNRLRDEIISVFNPDFTSSTGNGIGRSRRRGLELDATVRPTDTLRIGANYTLLDARDPATAAGARLRETRRPRHSGNLFADWEIGPATLGAALSYVGRRRDTDFDVFDPAIGDYRRVTLYDYLLVSARAEMPITRQIAVFVRGENLTDADFEDAVGYETPGLGIHAGIRLRIG